MKLSAHEEYGLRCLLRIGLAAKDESLTIPEISQAEALSPAYTAKLLRTLRRGGFITSARGKTGGYALARPAGQIVIGDVIGMLGGRLFESKNFCHEHAGQMQICTRSVDCSVRSLWQTVQSVVDEVLSKTTLQDLLRTEGEMNSWVKRIPSHNPLTFLQ
jgi:Rrf2 family protein